LSQFKKYHLSGNLKFDSLGVFQSLKYLILMEKDPFNFSYRKFLRQILWAVGLNNSPGRDFLKNKIAALHVDFCQRYPVIVLRTCFSGLQKRLV